MQGGILKKLQKQLLRYQNMDKKERKQACGAHAGMCAYLSGAIAATQHAIDEVEGRQ